LRRAIAKLDQPLCDVIVLCDLTGMTLAETAKELDIPVNTAKDRLRRARGQLRMAVQKLNQEAQRA
jgi:DNA-directed RNA polymerase specialized sigma24 family protein